MPKEYRKLRICLSGNERQELQDFVSKGDGNAMDIRRANIILMADESMGHGRTHDVDIAKTLSVSAQTVYNAKVKFLDETGTSSLLPTKGVLRKKRETPPVPAKVTGDVEAKVVALAKSEPPKGVPRWTLRLLADEAVRQGIVDSISHTRVRGILKSRKVSTPDSPNRANRYSWYESVSRNV